MTTKRITAAVIDDLAPGAVIWDAEVRGFGARHRSRDTTYLLKTRINGVQRVLTIGRHGKGAWGPETARREAIRLLGMIRDGQDPAAARDEAKTGDTLSELSTRYMTEHAARKKKPRTVAEDARLLRRHILPALGDLKARDISKQDAARFHSRLHKTPVTANRSLALLSAIMGWAERMGERPDGSNPCQHIDHYPEKSRERLLTAAELGRLGEALAQAEAGGVARRKAAEDWRAIAAYRLLLFTGARLSEVLTLRWEWIDPVRGLARLPDSKTGAKNLPFPPGALAVLDALPRYAGNPHVLPGDREGGHFIGIQKPWQRIRAAAGLSDLRIHDLRHAWASTAVANGESLFIVGKVLGHKQASTTERYAHLSHDPAKAAADRVGETLRAMLSGQTVEVLVPQKARKG